MEAALLSPAKGVVKKRTAKGARACIAAQSVKVTGKYAHVVRAPGMLKVHAVNLAKVQASCLLERIKI